MDNFNRDLTNLLVSFPKPIEGVDDDYYEKMFDNALNQLINLVLAEINKVGIERIEEIKAQTKEVFKSLKFEDLGLFDEFWEDGIMPAFDPPQIGALSFFGIMKSILKSFLFVIVGLAVIFVVVYLLSRIWCLYVFRVFDYCFN